MAARPGTRLSRTDLFALVFFELSEAVGDEWSSRQLMEAAEQIVRLTENDFGLNEEPVQRSYANYYTYDTADAICSRCWQIACRETPPDCVDGECYDPTQRMRRIRELGSA